MVHELDLSSFSLLKYFSSLLLLLRPPPPPPPPPPLPLAPPRPRLPLLLPFLLLSFLLLHQPQLLPHLLLHLLLLLLPSHPRSSLRVEFLKDLQTGKHFFFDLVLAHQHFLYFFSLQTMTLQVVQLHPVRYQSSSCYNLKTTGTQQLLYLSFPFQLCNEGRRRYVYPY